VAVGFQGQRWMDATIRFGFQAKAGCRFIFQVERQEQKRMAMEMNTHSDIPFLKYFHLSK
jgi:hypothetical protein